MIGKSILKAIGSFIDWIDWKIYLQERKIWERERKREELKKKTMVRHWRNLQLGKKIRLEINNKDHNFEKSIYSLNRLLEKGIRLTGTAVRLLISKFYVRTMISGNRARRPEVTQKSLEELIQEELNEQALDNEISKNRRETGT